MTKIKLFLAIGLLEMTAMICNGQGRVLFPKISENGKTIADFIPKDWKIRDTISGDFNKDGLIDFAVVIQTLVFEDTININAQFQPNILLVLVRQQDKSLHLSTKAANLFGNCTWNNWGLSCEYNYQNLEVRQNTLGIKILGGGTLRQMLSYSFAFQNNDWYLISVESDSYSASPDNTEVYIQKINFLTNLKEFYVEHQNHKQSNYKKTAIEKKPLIKLLELSNETDLQISP